MITATISAIMIPLAVAIVFYSFFNYLAKVRKYKALPANDEEVRGLANEYRRLSDMAITAHEHVDLRLTDLGVRVDELRDQLDQMQRILKEVE